MTNKQDSTNVDQVEDYKTIVAEVMSRLADNVEEKRLAGGSHARCWDFGGFHSACRAAGHTQIVDVGGHPHIVCHSCGILRDIATVGAKLPGREVILDGINTEERA